MGRPQKKRLVYIDPKASFFKPRGIPMMDLEQIREGLKDRKLTEVAKNTGLHYNTVRAVASGHKTNPMYNVAKVLSDYLSK